jgi:triacylglycerol lipase
MRHASLSELGWLVRTSGLGRRDPGVARLVVGELGAYDELRRLRRSAVFAGRGVAAGEGQPVMMIPGFLGSQLCMTVMTGWLRRTGHSPEPYTGRDIGCGEREARRLEGALERIADRHGARVAIVGHSRGGHLARVLAVRRPELVSGIVTVCTPSTGPDGAHRLVVALGLGVACLGAAGLPRYWRPSCFMGDCCRDYRADLEAPLADGVGHVQMLSSADRVVDAALAADPAARQVALTTASHAGALVNAEVYAAIAEALAGFRAAEAPAVARAA